MPSLQDLNHFLALHPEALGLLRLLWTLKWWFLFYLVLYLIYLMEREQEKVWKPRLERLEKRKALFDPKDRVKM